MEFAVAGIEEVAWQSSSFDALALSQDKKDTLVALAEARTGRLDMMPFTDCLAGNGRGLNILLQSVVHPSL